MTQNLARFQKRAARYVLQTQDNTLVRFAGPQQTPWEEGTEIQNISLTGLAFTAPADLAPLIGELIKIEFEVPGASRMACFGVATRLDPHFDGSLQVAVKFHKMDMAQRIFLAQGLAQKLKLQQLDRQLQQVQQFDRKGRAHVFLGVVGITICIGLATMLPEISRLASAWLQSLIK